ncbi:hypothetical protein B0H21DRAFT_824307 [Amylocystis lapponica]|nr:hypothetical protein B0H21DRAFT_824307 [Amylocystis lapponica]
MQIEELPDLSSHQTLYECYPSALNPPHPAPQFNFFMEMGMVAPIEEAYNFHRPVGQYDDEEMQQDSGYFSETAWQSDPDDWPVHPDDILGLRGDEYFSNSIPGYSSLMPPQVDAVDMQNVLPLTSQTHDFIHVNSCTGSVAGLSEPTVHEDLTAEIHPPKLNNIGDAPPFDQGELPNDVVESVPPPREIQALLDCHESHLPIGIMLCRDSSLIPFSLPEEYGCMFLGFFHVKHVRLQSGNRMPPVAAGYVRNPYATAPGTMPWDRYTDCVTSSFEEGANGQQTFDYCMGGDAVVKHLYTCNLGKFQHEPDRLFLRFQIDVELVMRGMKTGPVAGPYYTYVAMDGDVQGGISVPWAKVPPCVLQARELMLGRGHTDGRQPTLSIGQLVVLGWIRPGSRKGCIVSAKKSCVMILCLGADVELSIAAKSVRRPPVPPVSSNGPAFEPIEPVNAVPIDDLGDNAGGNELGGSLPNEISTSRPKVGKGKCIKEKMPPESLFVTLVHGDILMFMGGDFEYAMKRTGMSIILIGSS